MDKGRKGVKEEIIQGERPRERTMDKGKDRSR